MSPKRLQNLCSLLLMSAMFLEFSVTVITDWLTNSLSDWLTVWLTNWLFDWLTDFLSHWLIASSIDWLVAWFNHLSPSTMFAAHHLRWWLHLTPVKSFLLLLSPCCKELRWDRVIGIYWDRDMNEMMRIWRGKGKKRRKNGEVEVERWNEEEGGSDETERNRGRDR